MLKLQDIKVGDKLTWHRADGPVACNVLATSDIAIKIQVDGWLGTHWEKPSEQHFERVGAL